MRLARRTSDLTYEIVTGRREAGRSERGSSRLLERVQSRGAEGVLFHPELTELARQDAGREAPLALTGVGDVGDLIPVPEHDELDAQRIGARSGVQRSRQSMSLAVMWKVIASANWAKR